MKVEILQNIIPGLKDESAQVYSELLADCFSRYQINTPLRQAHFMAQVLHESGNFRYNEEIASGAAYEGRKDLGNIEPGDGKKFKGRGWIQLTGRENYKKFGTAIGMDLLKNPHLVATDLKADAAGYFWNREKLNNIADLGAGKEIVKKITKRVNGGQNGLDDRIAKFQKCYGELIKQTI